MAIVIGIRELRQHASRYLRRVREGETITLTDRGQPFAEIRPVKPQGSTLDRLIAEGRATAPTADLAEFLREHPPRARRPGEPLLSDTVSQMREEERY